MSTYTRILYQIVICTYNKHKAFDKPGREELFKCITGILKNKKCHLYIINGVEDHIHILTHVHPTIAVANLVKDIKLGATSFIKEKKLFPKFQGWKEGYGAFTYSIREKEQLINYVANQERHHSTEDFITEYLRMLDEAEINYDEQYVP